MKEYMWASSAHVCVRKRKWVKKEKFGCEV